MTTLSIIGLIFSVFFLLIRVSRIEKYLEQQQKWKAQAWEKEKQNKGW